MTNEVIIGVFIVVAFYLLSSRIKRFRNINHNQRKRIVKEQG
ncbi:MAG: hypothetical protein PUC55_01135 [Lachnospiraceae bacterium]|nr:hypothetical protein [Lachnospiraceae bacterium]